MVWHLLKLGDRHMGVHYSLIYHPTFVGVWICRNKTSCKEQRQNKDLSGQQQQQRKIIKKEVEVIIIQVEDADAIKRAWETIWEERWWVEFCTCWLWDATLPHLNIHQKSVHLGKSISGSFKKNFKAKQTKSSNTTMESSILYASYPGKQGFISSLCFLAKS